jgi:superfamily II DNA or RNA helicase
MPVLAPAPARIDGEIVFAALAPPALERLRLKLQLTNPKYVALKRFHHGFTGTEPEKIECCIEMPDGSVHVPRGTIALLKEQLRRHELAPRLGDDRRSHGERIRPRESEALELRDYQLEAIAKLRACAQGLVLLPCGCGKTKLGVGAILAFLATSLVLVHTSDLADQWLEELSKYGLCAGLVGNGKDERGADVVVGIIDSVLPLLEGDPTWGQRFGFVLVDEAHHAPAITFQRVLRLLPAYYRLGLTATPEREDGLTSLVDWSFGDVLIERSTREMIKLGYLMPAEIVIAPTGWTWTYDGPEKKRLATLEQDLASDLLRNALIADTVAREARAGETCLVLVRTREHAKELAEMISMRGVEARALTGKTAKKKRRSTISDLRGGHLAVAVATSLADEGLDLPRLSVIALAAPARAKGATIQRLGRLLRVWPGKKPKLYDFVDDEVDTLASRATARRRVYLDAGLLQPAA